MNNTSEIKAAAAAALARAEELLPAWLPGGQIRGREYECGNVAGGDGDSCRVNLDTGKWSDFATNDHGTDLVGLYASINHLGQAEAARELVRQLGMIGGTLKAPQGRKTTAPKADWLPVLPVPANAPTPDFHHYRLGDPVTTWTYRDRQGRVLGHIARFNLPDGTKEILPLTRCAGPAGKMVWRWKSFPTPRPLYGLDRLSKSEANAPVLLCEGEKACDSAQEIFPGAVAMTWPGGSKAMEKADFTPLSGRSRVNICPDADKPGFEAALAVAALAKQAGAAEVFILPPPEGVPSGWDLADPMPAGATVEEFVAGIISVEEFTVLAREKYGISAGGKSGPRTATNDSLRSSQPEGPRPLRRPICDAIPYPMNALGPILGPAAERIAAVVQAPAAMCAQSVLAAAALATQPFRNVVNDGRVSPLSCFFVTIGESGERKSEVDRQVLWPHRKHEKSLAEKYTDDMEEYKIDAAAWGKAKEQALARGKTFQEKQSALKALGAEPEAPLHPIIIASDPTIEGLLKLLDHGQPYMGLFSDEGGRLIGGHAMNQENQLRTMAGLCCLWDGAAIDRVRGGDGAQKLYGRRVSLHLMAQPKVASLLLGNALAADQGLLSRCLTTWPASTAGGRLYKSVDLSQDAALRRYGARALEILESPLPLAEGKRNELAPRPLELAQDAKAIWVRFHDHVERQLGDGGKLAPIRGFANKAPEHVLRIAGVLASVDDLDRQKISLAMVEAGVVIVQHYLAEALRVLEVGQVDQEILLAEKLLAWAATQPGGAFHLAQAYQRGPYGVRDAKTARRIIDVLVEHGHLVRVEKGAFLDGAHRRDVWEVTR